MSTQTTEDGTEVQEMGSGSAQEVDQAAETTENSVSERLFGAAAEVKAEIDQCEKTIQDAETTFNATVTAAKAEYDAAVDKAKDEKAAKLEEAEARRDELNLEASEAVAKMQAQFGFGVKQKTRPVVHRTPKTQATTNGKDKPIRALILDYMEKNRSATTKEIKSFLQGQGRTTNPGVELSRMVKERTIINKSRGQYVMPGK